MSKRIHTLEDPEDFEDNYDVYDDDEFLGADRWENQLGLLNPRPTVKQGKFRRVDDDDHEYRFRGKLEHYWVYDERIKTREHRLAIFQTSGKQLVIHYTAQCRAYYTYDCNVIRVVPVAVLQAAANKPRGWRGWFHRSFDRVVDAYVTHELPYTGASYIHSVLSHMFEEPDNFVFHVE